MQLHSIFSFLGKNPMSSDGDVDESAGKLQSTGFGAMLSSTLAMLAHKGEHAAAGESAAADRQAGAGENVESEVKTHTEGRSEGAVESIPGADAASNSGNGQPLVDDTGESRGNDTHDELVNSSADSDEHIEVHEQKGHNDHPLGSSETDVDPSGGDSAADVSSNGRHEGRATSIGHSDGGGTGRSRAEAATAHLDDDGAGGRAHSNTSSSGSGDSAANAAGRQPDTGGGPIAGFAAGDNAKSRTGNNVNGSDALRVRSDSSTEHRTNASGHGRNVLREMTAEGSSTTLGVGNDAGESTSLNNQHPQVNGDVEPTTSAGRADATRPNSATGPTGEQAPRSSTAFDSAPRTDGTLTTAGISKTASAESILQSETKISVEASSSHPHAESATDTKARQSHAGELSGERKTANRTEHISAPHDARSTAMSNEVRAASEPGDRRIASDRDERPATTTQAGREYWSNPADPVRAAELERSARRFSADRIRITVEMPAANSSSDASAELQASTLDRSALEARTAADHEHAKGARTNGQNGTTTRSTTASANLVSPNATSGGSPSLDSLTAAETDDANPTTPTKAEVTNDPLVDTAELDAKSRAAAKPSGADDRTSRDARADADRTGSRTASTDHASSGKPTNNGADPQSDFASGTDSAPDDAFDVAAAERSSDIVDFDDLLHEDVATDVQAPIDVQFSESPDEMTFSPDKARSNSPTSHVAETHRPSQPRQGGIVNWVRAKLEDGLKAISIDEGWKVLEMKLDEGQGTMTIRARRDEEKVSITVNFTDPQLRALAAENVDHLQESLRSQYQADVDFSLMSDNADQSQHQSNGAPRGGGRPTDPTSAGSQPISGADRARAARAAHSGARNEWIG